MTAHDEWLTKGSDGPREVDEDILEWSMEAVVSECDDTELGVRVIKTLYHAYPAIQAVFSGMCLGQHSEAFIELSKLVSDIRAKVDDEYQARITTYDDPRD